MNDSGSTSDRTDTYIYAKNSTDSTEDDVVLMVLEDISTDLTVADFLFSRHHHMGKVDRLLSAFPVLNPMITGAPEKLLQPL